MLVFIESNSTNQNQKKFSDRTGIEYGVPYTSVLGTLLFNINMINIFYECEDLCCELR